MGFFFQQVMGFSKLFQCYRNQFRIVINQDFLILGFTSVLHQEKKTREPAKKIRLCRQETQ